MAMAKVIVAEKLSKSYNIGKAQQKRYVALRDVIGDSVRSLLRPGSETNKGNFAALQEVSFSVEEGDRIGIIGHNGAGKSTLLKILARITEPTSGQVTLKGRVASLLEVGTGFHPELTGRENIFLNGAILGMRRDEIRRKFDQIVDFADVEKFLDTPVKRYSSGMYVRLAFAVAAHLESKILILDEVLAVGDLQFQLKCLKRMEDATTREGKTVLFVSHNLQAVSSICNRGMLLSGGRLIAEGDVPAIIDRYVKDKPSSMDMRTRLDRSGTGASRIMDIRFRQSRASGQRTGNAVVSGVALDIMLTLESLPEAVGKPLRLVLIVTDKGGARILPLVSEWQNPELTLQETEEKFVFTIPGGLHLMPDVYHLTAGIALSGIVADKLERAIEFDVVADEYFPTGAIPSPAMGSVLAHFTCERVGNELD